MSWKFDDGTPIYLQIAERIREQIAAGEISPGGKVPTVREIAETAGVNPNTVQRALAELEATALVASERGNGGRFVCDNPDLLGKLKHDMAATATRDFLAKMRKLGYDKANAGRYLSEFKEES